MIRADGPAAWDGPVILAALAENRRARNLADARDLVLVTRYCELSSTPDEIQVDGRTVVPGSERMIQPGGVGTPRIREFAITDVAARMHRSHDATRSFIADALDLRYRLPSIWRRLTAGDIEIWRAREVARATRGLTADAARLVDAEVERIVDSIGPRRLDRVVQAAVIAADPDDADRTVRDHDDRQVLVMPSVRLGRKDIFIRADVADVIRFDAAVDFVADLLAVDGDMDPKVVRRARAVGVIADPNAVLDLFARTRLVGRAGRRDHGRGPHPRPELQTRDDVKPGGSWLDAREPAIDEADAIADFDLDRWSPALNDAMEAFEAAGWPPVDPPTGSDDRGGGCCHLSSRWRIRGRPGASSAGVRDWRDIDRGHDVGRTFPAVTLVVHMNQSTFWWDTRDPCRLEDPGNPGAPITAEQAFELLGHGRVTIQPVLDLNNIPPVDAYEVRGRLRQAVVMKSAGACPFPYCDTFSRHEQCDHTINWPRGPSEIGNLAVADTRHHRVKTHSSWQVRQPFPGTYVWKDPYGQRYVVDHHGTREMPFDEAA